MSNRALVYRTLSNYEKKGIEELEQYGASAFTCWDESGDRAKVTAPGYIFSNRAVQAAFLKHVMSKPLGTASLADIANLYVGKTYVMKPTSSNPFKIGQSAWHDLVPCTIAGTAGDDCTIAFEMAGKQHVQTVHYSRIRPG